jgi:hypothetical protein
MSFTLRRRNFNEKDDSPTPTATKVRMRKMPIVEVDDEEERYAKGTDAQGDHHRDRRRVGGIEDAEGPPKGTHKKGCFIGPLPLYVDAPFIFICGSAHQRS